MTLARRTSLLLSAVALALLLALIALFTIDLGVFKNMIVGFASDYLEREIAIDGPLSIEIGSKVQVAAQDVRVASADWTEVADLVTVESAELTVDTWSLLKGIVLFDDFRASGIRANLAVDDAGNDNWTFPGLEDDEDEETTPLAIRHAEITDARLTFVSPDLPPIQVSSSTIDLRERPDGGLDFELLGTLNDAPVSAAGNAGTLDNIIEGRDVHFEVAGEIGEITLTGSGLIDDLYEPGRPVLELSVVGPNAEYLTNLLGVDPVTSGPFNFDASVAEADDVLGIIVAGTFGEFDLDLNGSTSNLQTLDNLAAVLHAGGPNIDTIARIAGQSGFPERPFSVDAELALVGEALSVQKFLFDVGTAKLEATASLPHFPGLDGAQANLNAGGPDFGDFNRLLGLPGRLTGPFEMVATLNRTDSGSDLDALLTAKDIQASAQGALTDHPELVGSRVTVAVSGDDASVIAAALDVEDVPAEPFGAGADLAVQEATIAVTNGVATLGPEKIELSGTLGLDPMAPGTRLSVAARFENLAETVTRFSLPAEGIPTAALTMNGDIGRVADAYRIESLALNLGEVDARIDGRIGDSMALADVALNFEVSGRNLAELVPLEEAYLSNEPFRAAGSAGFRGEEILELADLEVVYGSASARVSLTLPVADPLSGGEVRVTAEGPSLSAIVPVAAEYFPEADAFSVSGGGRWQGDSLWLEDTTVQVGEAMLDVRGELHAPPAIAGTALTMRASIPSLKTLELVAEQELPDEPLTLSADLIADGNVLRLSDFNLALGESDLAGSASYRPPQDEDGVAEFAASLQSKYLDLRPVQAALATRPDTAAPEPEDGRLIPDTPIPLEEMKLANGTIDVLAERMLLQNADVSNLELAASLKDGALVVDRFGMTGSTYGGTLGGALRLVPSADGAEFRMEVDGANLIAGLPAKTEEERQLLPRYEVSTRLAASGSTARELAATSRGYLRLVVGEGRIALGGVGFLMQDFAGELFNAVNPFAKKEPYSRVQCAAVLVDVKEGIIRGKPAVVFQTDKLNVTGVGRVNLATEELKAKFASQARKGIGIGMSDLVSPLTEVGGTLAEPRLQLNAGGTLLEGGAAVATGGLSFLAKKARDRLFSSKNPCRKIIAEADQMLAEGLVPLSEPVDEPEPER